MSFSVISFIGSDLFSLFNALFLYFSLLIQLLSPFNVIVTSTSTEFSNKDVFIHHSILPRECQGIIKKGQMISMKIINKKKGLQAIEIMLRNISQENPIINNKEEVIEILT